MLPWTRVCLATALLLTAFSPGAFAAPANASVDPQEGLAGLVRSDRSPLAAARVYAYQVSDLSLTKAETGGDGRFLFGSLPAGVYKVIAYKNGFVPAIVLVTRAAHYATDYLEFELVAERQPASGSTDDFWSVRRKIPTDVLRQIELAEMGVESAPLEEDDTTLAASIGAGYDRAGSTDLQRTDARLSYSSDVGPTKMTLDGDFQRLRPQSHVTTAGNDVNGDVTAIRASFETAAAGDL